MATGSTTKTIGVTGTTEVEFPPSGGAAQVGLSWVEIYHVNGSDVDQTFVHAPTDLNDDADYYEGYKEPRVIGFGEITRALSDARGQYEASEFSWTVADTDRLIRGWLGNAAQKYLQNRQVVIRMIDDASRRLKIRPRTLVRGIIRGYKPRGPLHFEFRARDFVASLFGSGNNQKQIPQEAITRLSFPACPPEALGKPVPLIFGTIGDGVSASAPPTITGTAADGFYLDGGVWPNLGFGNLTGSAAAVPTGLAVAAAAGGTMPATVPNAEWGVAVTAVDASGIETDPAPFYFNIDYAGTRGGFTGTPVPFTAVDGTQKLSVSWNAAANASKYRVYFGYYYYGFRVARYVEVNAPTVSVDILTENDGNPVTFAGFWYYTVSAILGDGETAQVVPEAFAKTETHRRPIKIEWTAVVGATSYKVRRRGAGGTWDREWEIAAPTLEFEDDLLDTGVTYISGAATLQGGVPVTYVGTELDDFGFPWESFLICGHQVAEIPQVFQNNTVVDPGSFGVTFLVPGQSGYSTYFAGHAGTPQYKVVNTRRYSMLYVRGPAAAAAIDGTQPITVNVVGRLDATDGAALTQLADIYKDFVINFGFQDSGGAHLAAPNWPADVDGTVNAQVDAASFDAMKTVHAARLVGGYPGGIAFGLNGEFVTLRDAIARLNTSNDCWSGFNRNSQFFVTIFNEALDLGAQREYTQVSDIVKASLDIDPDVDGVENVIVYSFRRNYVQVDGQGAWDQEEKELEDATAIADLREERRSQTLELHGVRNGNVALDIAQRRLVFYKEPPVPVTLLTNLRGLSTELGDVVLVTHTDGITSTGYSLRPLLITRHITNPQKYTVRLVGLDVQRIFDHYNP